MSGSASGYWNTARAVAIVGSVESLNPLVRYLLAIRDAFPDADSVLIQEGPLVSAVVEVRDDLGRLLGDMEDVEAAVAEDFDFRAPSLVWWKNFRGRHDPGEARFVPHTHQRATAGQSSRLYRLEIDHVVSFALTPEPTWLDLSPTRLLVPRLFSDDPFR